MLNIFDCSNWIRIQYEVDKSGLALRNIYNQALYSKDSTCIFVAAKTMNIGINVMKR